MCPRVGRLGAVYGVAAGLALIAAPAAAVQQVESVPAPVTPAQSGVPDPDAPMAEIPDIGVAWPDLATAPDAPTTATTDAAAETRYTWRIDGLDGVDSAVLRQRFADLSTLNQHDGDRSNTAQLDRRAREDGALLTTLLRGEGFYDARVDTRVDIDAGKPVVVLEATPGALYRFKGVTIDGVAAAGAKADTLTKAFGVKANDPVNADKIVAGQAALTTQVGEEGFPFAKIGEPAIVVDHATKTATLALDVVPGDIRKFGKITTNADNGVFGAGHVQEIARFVPGQEYDASALDDLRRALVQTGLVSSADVKPVEGSGPGTVDVAVNLTPAPPRTIAGEVGYGTGEGARAEVSWTHRNFFPPEGAITLRGVLGTQEQLASLIYRRNNFHGRDRVLTAQIAAANLKRNAYEAKTFSISGSLERQTNIFFQKAWTWSVGAELVTSDERDVIVSTGAPRRRTYYIGALPTTLNYDGSDDLLNPTKGFRLGGRFSPEVSLQGAAFGYARIQLDGSAYQPINDRVVLAGRIRLGTIAGAPRDQIAPSRRFYAGGGASVRGYGYQSIGPRDPNNDPIGGRSLTEFSIEARVKAFGPFGVVPFFDAGNIYTSPLPKLQDLRYGTGIGVRYYSNFGPIRIDVGTPLTPQPGDSRIAVYVSLGQAF